jgi:hypothetical protein
MKSVLRNTRGLPQASGAFPRQNPNVAKGVIAMIQIKCGECGHLDQAEKFESIFCNGPEDYQCPNCGYFHQRKLSDTQKKAYTEILLSGLISSGHAVYIGKITNDDHTDKYYRMGIQYLRIRTVNGDETPAHRIFNHRESKNITNFLLPIMESGTTGN